MKWFKRRQKTVNEEPPKCKHKWKDFPWYTEFVYDGDWATITITEPYVCIFCKERKNIKLYETRQKANSQEEAIGLLNNIKEQYSEYIEAHPLVEDQINDMQLVDREYIKAYELLKNGSLFK